MKKYRVTLTQSEVDILDEITSKGKRSAKIIRNAYILLQCNETDASKGRTDEAIAGFLGVTTRTIENIRKKFVLESFEIALYGRASSQERPIKVDGDVEAHLIALSCHEPPEGYARWSLRLLAGKMVELKHIESISHETVRSVLKKRIETLA